MPLRCTCGAQPPDDARFCHKCGRPLYEMDQGVEEETTAVVPPPPPPAGDALPVSPREIGFRNRIAVRSGLFAAAVSSILTMVIPLGALVVPVAAGFVSVWLYRRRTGEELSVGRGARMGWITGVFCFIFAAAMLTLSVATISGSAEARQAFREQAEAQSQWFGVDPDMMLKMFLSPAGIMAVLVLFFVLFTVLPMVGGAMGAKVLEKE